MREAIAIIEKVCENKCNAFLLREVISQLKNKKSSTKLKPKIEFLKSMRAAKGAITEFANMLALLVIGSAKEGLHKNALVFEDCFLLNGLPSQQ